jgi:hypothetical protein
MSSIRWEGVEHSPPRTTNHKAQTLRVKVSKVEGEWVRPSATTSFSRELQLLRPATSTSCGDTSSTGKQSTNSLPSWRTITTKMMAASPIVAGDPDQLPIMDPHSCNGCRIADLDTRALTTMSKKGQVPATCWICYHRPQGWTAQQIPFQSEPFMTP